MAVACLNNRAACYLQLKSYLAVVQDTSEVLVARISNLYLFAAQQLSSASVESSGGPICLKVIRLKASNFKATHRRMAALDAISLSSSCVLSSKQDGDLGSYKRVR